MTERVSALVAIALGGACGALARYALSAWMIRRFPMGTLFVNVLGCLLIGLIVAGLQHNTSVSPAVRGFLIIGFLGSLTTFSTFGFQSIELLLDGHPKLSLLNVFANVLIGFAAVWIGLALGRTWSQTH